MLSALHWNWAAIGYWTLAVLGALAGCAALDCLYLGLKDWRREPRRFDREVGLLTAATGLGLAVVAVLLFWAAYAVRG